MKGINIITFKIIWLCLLFSSFQAQAMTTHGANIVDSSGKTVELKGINWFGFNSGTDMVAGLWSANSFSGDFQVVAQRIKALGFNAIRIPFSFSNLTNKPGQITSYCDNLPSLLDIQATLINPNYKTFGTIEPFYQLISLSPRSAPNSCNSQILSASNTVLERLVYVAQFFAQNGFYVLLDNHLREDQTIIRDGILAWATQWKNLVQAVKTGDPSIDERFMFDILNEPDNFGIRWQADNGSPFALGEAYLAAMDAIAPSMPGSLFFIEGAGQGNANGANWGDGFQTKFLSPGASDPNPFFLALLKKNYLNQVVISPHVYPQSVTFAPDKYSDKQGLFNRLSTSFGYLTKEGYCNTETCHVFPVAIGEFGSKFEDKKDLDFLSNFAFYLNNFEDARDNKHTAITNWFYWDWNANSGDTGGIVHDDWQTIHWNKIDYLTTSSKNTNGLGLIPWYVGK